MTGAARSWARHALDRLVVLWCWASGSHFIEEWWAFDAPLSLETFGHSGCESCTWCVECDRLIGREAVDGSAP